MKRGFASDVYVCTVCALFFVCVCGYFFTLCFCLGAPHRNAAIQWIRSSLCTLRVSVLPVGSWMEFVFPDT